MNPSGTTKKKKKKYAVIIAAAGERADNNEGDKSDQVLKAKHKSKRDLKGQKTPATALPNGDSAVNCQLSKDNRSTKELSGCIAARSEKEKKHHGKKHHRKRKGAEHSAHSSPRLPGGSVPDLRIVEEKRRILERSEGAVAGSVRTRNPSSGDNQAAPSEAARSSSTCSNMKPSVAVNERRLPKEIRRVGERSEVAAAGLDRKRKAKLANHVAASTAGNSSTRPQNSTVAVADRRLAEEKRRLQQRTEDITRTTEDLVGENGNAEGEFTVNADSSLSPGVEHEIGAFRVEGVDYTHQSSLPVDDEGGGGVVSPEEPGGLPIASLVPDGCDHFGDPSFNNSLSSAESWDPFDFGSSKHRKQIEHHRFCAYRALIVIFISVAIGVAVSVTIVRNSNRSQDDEPSMICQAILETPIQNVVGCEDVSDPNSPYAKAFNWIINDDPQQLPPDAPNFIQRYIASYLYYATTKDNDWRSCNAPSELKNATAKFCTWMKLTDYELFYLFDHKPSYKWLSNISECLWAGVTCNGNLEITGIDLSGQGVSGTFPEGIYSLPYLKDLDFTLGTLHGKLPPELPLKLHHLNAIKFGRNSFTGSIPDVWWAKASQLHHVTLSNNLITGSLSAEIGNMRDLKKLYLANNSLAHTLPTEIGLLDSISAFVLAGNKLTGSIPSTIGSWRSMTNLWLHDNQLVGPIPPSIGNLSTLKGLLLHTNRLSGDLPKSLWNLTELTRLDLGQNNLTGTLATQIGRLGSRIRHFDVSINHIHGTVPSELGQLSKLHKVQVYNTDLTGTIPENICELRGKGDEGLISFVADCAPDSSGFIKIECHCCTVCCEPDGRNCLEQQLK